MSTCRPHHRAAHRRCRRWLFAIGLMAVIASVPPAMAADRTGAIPAEGRYILNPQPIEIRRGAPKTTRMAARETAERRSAEKQLELTVEYTDHRLYNPDTNVKDPVRLRSYTGTGVDPARPYVAPTIEVFPGDTVRVTLHNKLPTDPSCTAHGGDPNIPHCFNGTNLHTHGLWISPAGNSDNVLISVNPGVSFEYEYNIPPDHPAGTFWYHPHRHGSTALQVSSGMAGALIVRGDRPPTATANGDIDTILKTRDGRPFTERVLVLQQIQYACLDANGAIKVERDAAGQVVRWVCDPGDVGGIEFYDDPGGNGLFGFGTWGQSGRHTSINGLVWPTFESRAGQIERWRLIHGGVRDTINLQFRRMRADAPPIDGLKAGEVFRFINDNCSGEPLPFHRIAADGLTLAAARRVTQTVLQPGYRDDALVVFPEAGKYCVLNAAVPAAGNVSQDLPTQRLLGVVAVDRGRAVADIPAYLNRALIAAAERTLPEAVRKLVVADLRDGFKLGRFVAHRDIGDDEVTGTQELTFFIDTSVSPAKGEVSNAPYDPKPYDPARIDRVLSLGGVDEWILRSRFASHPFHIHVNPFQIVRILDPNGRDVSAADAVDDAGGAVDPQYPGLKGVWKDTLMVKSLIPPAAFPQGVYTVVVRSRNARYIGDYVLHCHILDHEDIGMMQNVRVAVPDGAGGTAHGHH